MQVLFSIFIVYVLSQIVTFYTFEAICSMLYIFLTFLLSLMAAAKMRDLAQQKGHNVNFLHVLAWCFWFPIFGYLYVIALPDLILQKQNEEIINRLQSDNITANYVQQRKDMKKIYPSNSSQQSKDYDLSQISEMSKSDNDDIKHWICKRCGERNSYDKNGYECGNCGDTYK